MDTLHLIQRLNETLTFFLVFPGIVALGLYLTFRLRFVQIFKLRASFKLLIKPSDSKSGDGSISHYEAIAAVLAGNFGTGNISGMAIALSSGGPGALVWMWIMAFLGSAIQYASCVLGIKFRTKNARNEYAGGPMYYISSGLGLKKIGAAFAFCALLGAITVGNFAQVNSLALPMAQLGISPLYTGFIVAILAAVVLLGGMQRFARVSSSVVPIMALLYFCSAAYILLRFAPVVPHAFGQMISSAFSIKAIGGGTLGYGVLKAITTGFDRGLFATDAGTGIAPIMQASTKSKNPVIDGLVTLVAPLCVMIVCTTTALVLMVTGAYTTPELESTNMVTHAFTIGMNSIWGSHIVFISLFLFSYTTILAWACCGEKAFGYLFGTQNTKLFTLLFIAMIPLGALIQVNLVWTLADISISLMLIFNLIGIAGLSRYVIEESRYYLKSV